MVSGRRDAADKPLEKRDGLRDEVGAAVRPRALALVRDPAAGGPGEPIVGERGPSVVAGETFERLAVVIGDHDPCVQGSRKTGDEPRAEAVGAAHEVGGGGGGGTPGGGGLGLELREQVGARPEPAPRLSCAQREAAMKPTSLISTDRSRRAPPRSPAPRRPRQLYRSYRAWPKKRSADVPALGHIGHDSSDTRSRRSYGGTPRVAFTGARVAPQPERLLDEDLEELEVAVRGRVRDLRDADPVLAGAEPGDTGRRARGRAGHDVPARRLGRDQPTVDTL